MSSTSYLKKSNVLETEKVKNNLHVAAQPNYIQDNQIVTDVELDFDQEDIMSSYVVPDQPRSQPTVRHISQESSTLSYVDNCQQDSGTGAAALPRGTDLNCHADIFVSSNQHGQFGQPHGRDGVSLQEDIQQVQQVQDGGIGVQDHSSILAWNTESEINCIPATVDTGLPFQGVEKIPDMLELAPKQINKMRKLVDMPVALPQGTFSDKVLPASIQTLELNNVFTADYFVALHNIVAAPGYRGDGTPYSSCTPNHLGARVHLPHTKLKIDRWRYHLRGYENVELIQLLEYGFPIGLDDGAKLESKTRNHGSAYMWYDWVDKFVSSELKECGMAGPYKLSPWYNLTVSPLMTAHKKPLARRCCMDATFGDNSVNDATPSDSYLGQPTHFTYPKIEDYRLMVLKAGRYSWMWKRDLSRFFLQLPLDPVDYVQVGMVWRGLFFFFVGLAFGLRHSGLNGQRTTDAVSWRLRQIGQESEEEEEHNVCNYVDDFGGVQDSEERAWAAFLALGSLLEDLGLQESKKKAVPPTKRIVFLGVQFDSEAMEMSVPPDKVTEVKAEIRKWSRKTTISKKDLQSLLGKLMWVSKVVKYSRPFMGRLLEQLRAMSKVSDSKKLKLTDESRKDILWWSVYLEHFNGVTMLINEDPIPLSYEQLLDSPHEVCAGDATPTGGGAWHGAEYWCQDLPLWLKDPLIPIHIKEMWVVLVSAKVWGESWTGRTMTIFCDNDAVCETLVNRKPRDTALLSLLREFLHLVVTWKFFPIVRKINTKKNEIADHLSRRYDSIAAAKVFSKFNLFDMLQVEPKTTFFNLSSNW